MEIFYSKSNQSFSTCVFVLGNILIYWDLCQNGTSSENLQEVPPTKAPFEAYSVSSPLLGSGSNRIHCLSAAVERKNSIQYRTPQEMQTTSYSFPPAKLSQLLHNICKENCHSEKLDLFPNTGKPIFTRIFSDTAIYLPNEIFSCLENAFVTRWPTLALTPTHAWFTSRVAFRFLLW